MHLMTWQKHQFSSMKNVVQRENIGFHRCKLPASFSQTCARGKGWGTFGCCLCADNFESCTPIVPNARFSQNRAFGTIGVQLSKLSAQRQQPKVPQPFPRAHVWLKEASNLHRWKPMFSQCTTFFIDENWCFCHVMMWNLVSNSIWHLETSSRGRRI